VPVLRAMHMRRLATYKSLGFRREQDAPRLVMAALSLGEREALRRGTHSAASRTLTVRGETH